MLEGVQFRDHVKIHAFFIENLQSGHSFIQPHSLIFFQHVGRPALNHFYKSTNFGTVPDHSIHIPLATFDNSLSFFLNNYSSIDRSPLRSINGSPELDHKSLASFGLLGFIIYWLYIALDWVWLTPKRYEKIPREQFKGNPYRILQGDQNESSKLIQEARSKPIALDGDASKRLAPHFHKTVETYGNNSFMWIGRIPRVNVADPDLVREILTKYYNFHKNLHHHDPITHILLTGLGMLEGDPWAVRRKIVKTAFFFEKLKDMLPVYYSSCWEQIMDKWDSKIPEGGSAEVELWEYFRALSGDVTSRVLFGASFKEGGADIYNLFYKNLSSLPWLSFIQFMSQDGGLCLLRGTAG